jgi:hypothetical protein
MQSGCFLAGSQIGGLQVEKHGFCFELAHGRSCLFLVVLHLIAMLQHCINLYQHSLIPTPPSVSEVHGIMTFIAKCRT